MVEIAPQQAPKPAIASYVKEDGVKWSTVSLSEIIAAKSRLDASVYGIEGKQAHQIVANCKWDKVDIAGEGGLSHAYHRPRFKRVYVEKSNYPIYQPSQITELCPEPAAYISDKTDTSIDELRVHKGYVLLTCSGTIGNCSLVSKTLDGAIFSHDLIRLIPNSDNDAGYIYTYLKSKTGNTIVKTSNYGAVISHIEPEHLAHTPIPNPPALLKQQIHDKIAESFKLRDESNDLIKEAQAQLQHELSLPPIEEFSPDYLPHDGLKSYSVKLGDLSERFDGSYHVPIVDSIHKHIQKHASSVTALGGGELSGDIILPGRFKRVYLEEGKGTVFIGGKQIFELDPNNKKYLSVGHHGKRIKDELTLHENMILITCSGTIGKVTIVPKHWDGWTANQHIIRVIADTSISGYLYGWLSSSWAAPLISRFTYGAVVDEIDDKHVAQIAIPLLKNSTIQKQINENVLAANKKRYEAYILEQEALKIMNQQVLGIS